MAHKEGESPAAYRGRMAYMKLGSARTLISVREQLGVGHGYLSHLKRWSAQFGWVEDARLYDRFHDGVTLPLAPHIEAELLDAIKSGAARHTCAGIIGIPYARYVGWLQLGLRNSGPVEKQAFARMVARAEARAKLEMIREVRASGDWKALFKLLEKVAPLEYGPEPQVADIEAADDEAATIPDTAEEVLAKLNALLSGQG